MGKTSDETKDMKSAETPETTQPQNSFCEHEQQKTPEEQLQLCKSCEDNEVCPLGSELDLCTCCNLSKTQCETQMDRFQNHLEKVLTQFKVDKRNFFKNQQ